MTLDEKTREFIEQEKRKLDELKLDDDNVAQAIDSKVTNNKLKEEFRDKHIRKVILATSASCAFLSAQPIPFADIFILTPIQIVMARKIASQYGFSLGEISPTQFVKEIGGLIGMGWIAQQTVLGGYKFIPGFGSALAIPTVFALTYGIGSVVDRFYRAKSEGKVLTKEEAKKIFKMGKDFGKQEAKKEEIKTLWQKK